MTTREQLIKRLRLLEQDHKPDGYPSVQMRDISALLDMLEVYGEPIGYFNGRFGSNDTTGFLWAEITLADALPTAGAKLYTAPQPTQPAQRVTLTDEQAIALREAHQIGASDAWFKARYEGLDTRHSRNIFEAGFNRGWEAAHGIKEGGDA